MSQTDVYEHLPAEDRARHHRDAAEASIAASGSAKLRPLGRMNHLAHARSRVDQAIRAEVEAARDEGQTWTKIAHYLNVTPQAAQQRYGKGHA